MLTMVYCAYVASVVNAPGAWNSLKDGMIHYFHDHPAATLVHGNGSILSNQVYG